MTDKKSVRVDKFLWAVRLFKTRSLAASACRMGRVLVNDHPVKPSGILKGNEILILKKPPVICIYRVKEIIENRVSAKLVSDYIEDQTPENEKMKLDIQHTGYQAFREKGSGRPTKKERRTIDRWKEGFDDI